MLIELPAPAAPSGTAHVPSMQEVSFTVSEPVVSALGTSPNFEGSKLVSIFLAAYQTLLYRYNPANKLVKVGLPPRKPAQPQRSPAGFAAQGSNGEATGGSTQAAPPVPILTVRFEWGQEGNGEEQGDESGSGLGNGGALSANGGIGKRCVSFRQVLSQVDEGFPGVVSGGGGAAGGGQGLVDGVAGNAGEEPDRSSACLAAFEFSGPVAVGRNCEESSPFELFLHLVPSRDGSISGQIDYSTSVYDSESMTRFSLNYVELLDSLGQGGRALVEAPVFYLPILARVEAESVMEEFTKRRITQALYGQVSDVTLVDIVERQANRTPERVAVVDKHRSLTYLELYRRAREIASTLLTTPELRRGGKIMGAEKEAEGISADDAEAEALASSLAAELALGERRDDSSSPELVGLGLDRSCEWVIAMVGILMAGLGYTPLDPSYPRSRIEKIAKMAELHTVFTSFEYEETFRWIQADGLAKVRRVEDHKGKPVVSKALEAARPEGTSVAYVLFTSGSTGEPKGVVVEHQGVRNMVHAFRNTLPSKPPPDIRGQLCSMTFDLHLMDVFCTFDTGGTVAICSKDDLLTDLPGFMVRYNVTGCVITPTVAALLEPEAVPSLQWLAFGGEQVPRVLIKKWIGAGRTVIDHYGPTECSVAAACQLWRPGDTVLEHIGKPLDGAHIYVLGPDLEFLPIGIPGELCISGIQVSQGYLKRPDLTDKVFVANPHRIGAHDGVLYRTGDRCRWLPEGNIQFLGRIDFQVKIRGNRVEPGEIEKYISRVPGVARCVVILRTDHTVDETTEAAAKKLPNKSGSESTDQSSTRYVEQQYLAAYMMVHPSADKGEIPFAVKEALQAQLPAYMVPSAYVVMDQLPQTASGKVDRKLLPRPSPENFQTSERTGSGGGQSCKDDEERKVANVFAHILGMKDESTIWRDSNFFALGGNSFLASQAVAHLQQAFGLAPSSLSIRQFFQSPTVEELARVLVAKQMENFLLPDQKQQKLVQAHLQKRNQPQPLMLLSPRRVERTRSGKDRQKEEANGVHAPGDAASTGSAMGGDGHANGEDKGQVKGHAPTNQEVYNENLRVKLLLSGAGQDTHRLAERHAHVLAHVPLSAAQEVMWMVLHVLSKPEVVDITDVWRVKGKGGLDAVRLEGSVQQLIVRHQSLRMRFASDRPSLGGKMMTAVLDRWGPKGGPGGDRSVGRMSRLTSTLAGVLGPSLVRNLHKIVPKCVDQIDQDPTIVPFSLAVVDLTRMEDKKEKVWEVRRCIEHARRPFDNKAAQGLLFRGTLIKTEEDESVLVFMFNHLIFDGISAAVFYSELQYVFREGTTEGLPAVASYADYVAWEADWLASGVQKREVAYWSNLLGKDPEPLKLTPSQSPKQLIAIPWRGAWIDFTIDVNTRVALEIGAHKLGATLNMAMLAAFHSLLHIWSNQRRIIIGTLVARRPLAEHQRMLGHVADIVPILADFRPNASQNLPDVSPRGRKSSSSHLTLHAFSKESTIGLSYADILVQVRERVLEALENQSITFRMVVSEVLAHPDFAKSTLVEAYFNFLQPGTNASPQRLVLGDCEAEFDLPFSWAREGEAAITPVCLNMRQGSDGSLTGRFVYQADVFDRTMMEAMVLQYKQLVQRATEMLPQDINIEV